MEDAQQQHDRLMVARDAKVKRSSVKTLDRMLAKKGVSHDPVNSIVKNHPTITPEKAAEIIEGYGF